MVATIAFGVGTDCPDMRQIIHWGVPEDTKMYVQMKDGCLPGIKLHSHLYGSCYTDPSKYSTWVLAQDTMIIINPRRMHKGYGSRFVCVSVTTLTATYLVYTTKVRQYRVSGRLLKIRIVWTSLKTLCSGDMASFACHDDRQLGSFLTKSTPMVLDTITNGIEYELLAKSDDYLE